MLNSLLWSGTDATVNARDPMQNLGQTRVFYKPDQTRLIQTKVTRLTQMTRPGFDPDCDHKELGKIIVDKNGV